MGGAEAVRGAIRPTVPASPQAGWLHWRRELRPLSISC